MQRIDFSDITNISATYQEGFRVNFAKFDNMDYKMKMLKAILPQVDRSPGTYIDLTTPSKVFTGREETIPTSSPMENTDEFDGQQKEDNSNEQEDATLQNREKIGSNNGEGES